MQGYTKLRLLQSIALKRKRLEGFLDVAYKLLHDMELVVSDSSTALELLRDIRMEERA